MNNFDETLMNKGEVNHQQVVNSDSNHKTLQAGSTQ